MLIERRIYTLKPGMRDAFMQAQIDRGFQLIAPIVQRLIGYFIDTRPDGDRIVHLYRFDSLSDWQQRLHGLYGVQALSPYFTAVRAVMRRQDNDFFFPAPRVELTPRWGNGNDWLPEHGPFMDESSANQVRLIQETGYLLPGKAPIFFDRIAAAGDRAGDLLGWMLSISGRQHRAVRYRLEAPNIAASGLPFEALRPQVADLVAEYDSATLQPVLDIRAMSPMFFAN